MASDSVNAVPQSGEDHGHKVAEHYNQLQESGLAERTKSRIFYLRNFNNWTKSMLIGEYLKKLCQDSEEHQGPDPQWSVLDLCSGKGGDLLKWKKGNISHLVCADIAGTSVEQCEVRYKEMVDRNKNERHPSKLFTADFYTADCSKQRLKSMYKIPDITFDLVSCQFSYHYSFESYKQADMMLRNACECLKPGGYFIGTTPNANELIKRLRNSDNMSYGNEVYRVAFCTKDKTDIPLFGAKYDFHLEGVVDCPEFVVYFPALEKLAESYGMKLIESVPFADFFERHVNQGDGRGLIGRMQGLEPYPADDDIDLMSKEDQAYATAKAAIDLSAEAQSDSKHKSKVGTLSQDEWEATTIYLAYAFQKVEDKAPPYDESVHCDLDVSEESTSQKCEESTSLKRPAETEELASSKLLKTPK